MQSEPPAPFQTEVHGGFSVARGIARLSGDVLVLELELRVLGLVLTGVREVPVLLAQIAKAESLTRLTGPRLRLRGRSLRTFDGVPGHDGAELLLEHRARDDEDVRAFHGALAARLPTRR